MESDIMSILLTIDEVVVDLNNDLQTFESISELAVSEPFDQSEAKLKLIVPLLHSATRNLAKDINKLASLVVDDK